MRISYERQRRSRIFEYFLKLSLCQLFFYWLFKGSQKYGFLKLHIYRSVILWSKMKKSKCRKFKRSVNSLKNVYKILLLFIGVSSVFRRKSICRNCSSLKKILTGKSAFLLCKGCLIRRSALNTKNAQYATVLPWRLGNLQVGTWQKAGRIRFQLWKQLRIFELVSTANPGNSRWLYNMKH